MDGSPPSAVVPHTPPSRSMNHSHRRLDSFPTDDIYDDSEFDVDDGSSATGVVPSISLGAFPVFLIQESPHKPVPQFPESPESTFGFQSPPRGTVPARNNQLLRQVEQPKLGAGEFPGDLGWDCQGRAQQTPSRAPIRVVHTISSDEWDQPYIERGLERKPSFAKTDMEFGRRLFQDEDETLLGHYEVSGEKLHPTALRYSSSTSTSLASPLSDTFSPASTACSISTNSSRLSPRAPSADSHEEHPKLEGLPTEVGGSVSFDLEVPSPYEQAALGAPAAILELKPLVTQTDITISSPVDDPNPILTSPHAQAQSCFTLAATHEPSTQQTGQSCSTTTSGDSREPPEIRATIPSQLSANPSLYGQLGLFRHPHFRLSQLHKLQVSDSSLPSERRSVSPPNTYTPASTTFPAKVVRRRAFSGTREFLQANRTTESSVLGRLRSCSVNSPDQSARAGCMARSNSLTVQAARSQSNSASGAVPYAASTGSRTLKSSKSKDSVKSKFANLPGYATFLREITLELWIDQEGFRAIRPQFELHRYTPGQLAPVRSTMHVGVKNLPVAEKQPGNVTPTSPVRSIMRRSIIPVTPPRQPQFSPSGSSLNECSPTNTSPTISRFPPQTPILPSGPGQEAVETPVEPKFLQNWGVAEFTMRKRQGWNFHHGMVDGEPILRRLTVNGVEDRDYLSREASLCVKSNGVYTVKGTEDRGRFEWKFEYLVEDRRGPSGALLHGEKTLTPLAFSCAPELLIPEQGKKVKLLHVMKKSMTPKIQSSKLDPPMVPTTPTSRDPANGPSTPRRTSSGSAGRSLAKIVRPSSAKSRPGTPKHGTEDAYVPSQTTILDSSRMAPSAGDGVDEYGRRRAASYSSMRPDLRDILVAQPET